MLHIKREIRSSLVLSISLILVIGSLLQILSTSLLENHDDHILKIQSIYAKEDGSNNDSGGIEVVGTTEEAVASTENATTNATENAREKIEDAGGKIEDAGEKIEDAGEKIDTMSDRESTTTGTPEIAPPAQQEDTQRAAPPAQQESTEKGGNILDQIWRIITNLFK